MITNYVYKYQLSDNSRGFWLTKITPDKAGYKLPGRFPGRTVKMIKWVNRP